LQKWQAESDYPRQGIFPTHAYGTGLFYGVLSNNCNSFVRDIVTNLGVVVQGSKKPDRMFTEFGGCVRSIQKLYPEKGNYQLLENIPEVVRVYVDDSSVGV
jgi:hypothetical protein